MSGLKEDSKLYMELDQMYSNVDREKHDFKLYNECVEAAMKFSKREIKYVIFVLKSMHGGSDTGIDVADKITKATEFLVGDPYKAAFIVSALETALDEK